MTSQQLIRLVSDDQLELIMFAFLDDCELANLSSNTIRSYRETLLKFHWWARNTGRPTAPEDFSPADMREFLRYVQSSPNRWGSDHPESNKPITPGGLDAYYRNLRRFWNWCAEQEYVERSPMDKRVRRPRGPRKQVRPFSGDELATLADVLKEAGEDELATRDRAIVAVLLDVGLRASELCELKIDDIDVMSGRLAVLHGKGDKARTVRLGGGAKQALRRYWIRHRARQATEISDALFANARGTFLTSNGLHQMLRRHGATAGIKDCHPHRFRHTFAINAIRAGMGLLELQTILGHSSLEMVRHYARIAETDIDRAAKLHSPLDRLKLGL